MKKIIPIMLLSIIMAYSMNQVGVFMEYIVDIEAYTDKYCENKEKPELNCNGTCHLTKELAKTEKSHKDHDLQAPPEVILINTFETIEIEASLATQPIKHEFHYQQPSLPELSYTILQPPKI